MLYNLYHFYRSNIIKKKPIFFTDSNVQLEEEVANLKIKDIESNDEYYCNSDDYDYDLDVKDSKQKTIIKTNLQKSNLQNISTKITSYQPKHDLLSRYVNKINLGKYEGPTLSAHVANELIKNNRLVDRDRLRVRDKSDHATNENVLDSRIKRKLHKLFDKEILTEINGCISTGKEANIYYAKSIKGDEIAIKIYRTSILTFKNREKYIRGEYRFQHVYSLHNPRKMVKIWAEKEFCNLKRLEQANIRAPHPILYSGDHILLMEFLGSDGWAAPKLKDVTLTSSRSGILYRECVEIMWKMYNKCRLVHADLSEYNMLYLDGSIAIIDVSQAVDRDHFNATEFLRNDCSNITGITSKHYDNVI